MPDRDIAIDLEAIRDDIAMAARSPEMARHVALDHAPELVAEVERLRTERAQWKALWRDDHQTAVDALAERDTLQAELEELRQERNA